MKKNFNKTTAQFTGRARTTKKSGEESFLLDRFVVVRETLIAHRNILVRADSQKEAIKIAINGGGYELQNPDLTTTSYKAKRVPSKISEQTKRKLETMAKDQT